MFSKLKAQNKQFPCDLSKIFFAMQNCLADQLVSVDTGNIQNELPNIAEHARTRGTILDYNPLAFSFQNSNLLSALAEGCSIRFPSVGKLHCRTLVTRNQSFRKSFSEFSRMDSQNRSSLFNWNFQLKTLSNVNPFECEPF